MLLDFLLMLYKKQLKVDIYIYKYSDWSKIGFGLDFLKICANDLKKETLMSPMFKKKATKQSEWGDLVIPTSSKGNARLWCKFRDYNRNRGL